MVSRLWRRSTPKLGPSAFPECRDAAEVGLRGLSEKVSDRTTSPLDHNQGLNWLS
jgi:hypothetical protein